MGEVKKMIAKLKELRQKKGISQQALGEMLGVSATAVHKWEHGQSQPDIPALQKLSQIFGVSIDELCDLLIPELESHLNVGYPTYGNFTYGQDYTVNSRKFFFPIPLLLADMHLWRASIRGQEEDYIKAAQYYHDYLVEEQYSV